MLKNTRSSRWYNPPPPLLEFRKRPAAWNYNSSKFISTPPPNFRERAHTMYHCIPPRKREFEPFFGKILICTFPPSNFCKQLHVILITIKYNLQSYSWWKDIIISVKLIVKASKNKKMQQKHKLCAPLIANSKQI